MHSVRLHSKLVAHHRAGAGQFCCEQFDLIAVLQSYQKIPRCGSQCGVDRMLHFGLKVSWQQLIFE